VAVWVAGWPAGLLSQPVLCQNDYTYLEKNPLEHMIAPSFEHLLPLMPRTNSLRNPFIGGSLTQGGGQEQFEISKGNGRYLGNGARQDVGDYGTLI